MNIIAPMVIELLHIVLYLCYFLYLKATVHPPLRWRQYRGANTSSSVVIITAIL